MAEYEQTTDQGVETKGGSDATKFEPKREAERTTVDIPGNPPETLDTAERLPEEPEEQNDFA